MKTLESKAIPVFTYECMDRVFGLCNTPAKESLLQGGWVALSSEVTPSRTNL